MRKTGSRFPWAAILLASLASSAFAYDTVNLTVKTPGSGPVMGGVYTSPYGVSIDGGPTTMLICDDFLTAIDIGDSWDASVLTLVDLQNRIGEATTTNPQTPKFAPGGLSTNSVVSKYAVAGVLASQLMSHLGLTTAEGQIRGAYSYALWAVFDPALLTANPLTGKGHLNLVQLATAQAFLTAAELVVKGATVGGILGNGHIDLGLLPFSNLTIYTPNPLTASQEFLQVSVAMPEPSSIAILALDLLGLAGLVLFVRRRASIAVR